MRHERAAPGELLHLDTKQLGRIGVGGGKRVDWSLKDRHRGIGWNRVHVAVDDHSRIAYVEELGDETPVTTVGFLRRAVAFYAGHGITVERVLTDNGNPYRSRDFGAACADLAISPRRTRPYRPQTNGKAERFIRTLLKRVGLCGRLPRHRAARRQPAGLHRLLQSVPTALVTRRPVRLAPSRTTGEPARETQPGSTLTTCGPSMPRCERGRATRPGMPSSRRLNRSRGLRPSVATGI